MRILLATDSFPPNCGGSGWSTWELARGLRGRGHEVAVVQPRPGRARAGTRTFDGFTVDEFVAPAPNVPFVRNYFKNERLYPKLAAHLADVIRRERIDLVHGQHVLTVPPAVEAAARTGIPSVATVRDYWPVCYWSTLIHDPSADSLCPGCSTAGMRTCLAPRTGLARPLALPFVPYMQRNLALKQRALAGAGAIIAVSRAIEADLRHRAPDLRGTRIERIPNPVDIEAVRAAATRPRPAADRYALFVGKLEANKGAGHLPAIAAAARLDMPIVIVGDGTLRPAIEDDARRRGADVRVLGWLPRPEALAWLGHAAVLVFPSHGPESLSRVLIEASALGVPIAAMLTGGTADVVRHGETGLLSRSVDALAEDVARLARDPAYAASLGRAAVAHVRQEFDAATVVARIEALYADLVGHGGGARAHG